MGVLVLLRQAQLQQVLLLRRPHPRPFPPVLEVPGAQVLLLAMELLQRYPLPHWRQEVLELVRPTWTCPVNPPRVLEQEQAVGELELVLELPLQQL